MRVETGNGGESSGMRPRRFLGILERAMLGSAMSAVLYVVEWQLSRRMKDKRDAENVAGGRQGEK
jgi:hypothetical protein